MKTRERSVGIDTQVMMQNRYVLLLSDQSVHCYYNTARKVLGDASRFFDGNVRFDIGFN